MFAYFLLLLQFIAFPDRKDSILQEENKYGNVIISSSGSIGQYKKGKCELTFPNRTLEASQNNDWCSNIATSDNDMPWITYSIKGKQMKLTGFAIRSGCCLSSSCCCLDGKIIDYCCCDLFSFSLQGSNDNKTWKLLHKVEKDYYFYYCQYKTYEINNHDSFQYVRLVMDQEYPGCVKCITVNQIELFGKAEPSNSYYFDSENDGDDESISIIGKIKNIN